MNTPFTPSFGPILVTTMGGSWQILPELLGFTNPEMVDLYRNHPLQGEIEKSRLEYGILPVGELWVIATCGKTMETAFHNTLKWYGRLDPSLRPALRIWQVAGTENLSTEAECRTMGEAIHVIVRHAADASGNGNLFLSLTGGRKTMSTDLQQAAGWFGCKALIHVVDNPNVEHFDSKAPPKPYALSVDDLLMPLPKSFGDLLTPFVVIGTVPPNPILSLTPEDDRELSLAAPSLPLPPIAYPTEIRIDPEFPLTTLLNERRTKAGYLMSNYTSTMLQGETVTNFLALYSLPRDFIDGLKAWKMGIDLTTEKEEIALLKQLPKAELHCHLGGVADAVELIRIAGAAKADVARHASALMPWLSGIKKWVEQPNPDAIMERISSLKAVRHSVPGVPTAVTTAAFILLFENDPGLLDEVIYGTWLDETRFCKIDFTPYERIGDLQGSGLLTHPACLAEACRVVAEKAIFHTVRYLEVRCSPVNYAGDNLSPEAVYHIIQKTLAEYGDRLTVSILFIASRHGDMKTVHRHVDLARTILEEETRTDVAVRLRGFDLAGDEGACSAANMQKPLMPMMKRCLHFTIHAGENRPAQSIWEAVYLLNAERIGHSLSLGQNPRLMRRFFDRNIVLEMCPSSNFQIIGYRDNYLPETCDLPVYPLKAYLDEGLRVTVNTDNPGISRTDFTRELHRACRLTPGGLNLWEILSMVRNSFKASFAPRQIRHDMLKLAEAECVKVLHQAMTGARS